MVSRRIIPGIIGLALVGTALVAPTQAQAVGDLRNGACPSRYFPIGTWPLYRNDNGHTTDYRIRVYVKKDSDEIIRVASRVFNINGPTHKRVYNKISRNGTKLKADASTGITDCVTAPNRGGRFLFYGSVAKRKGSPAIASNSISITFTRP